MRVKNELQIQHMERWHAIRGVCKRDECHIPHRALTSLSAFRMEKGPRALSPEKEKGASVALWLRMRRGTCLACPTASSPKSRAVESASKMRSTTQVVTLKY